MEELIKQVDFLKNLSFDTLKMLSGKVSGNLKNYLRLSLARLNYVTNAVYVLLAEYNKKKSLEFGIHVILRSAMLDTLFTTYIYIETYEKTYKDDEERTKHIEELCFSFLADGLSQTVDSVSKEFANGNIKRELYNDFCRNITLRYQPFFEVYKENQKPKVVKHEHYSPKYIYDEINKSNTYKTVIRKIYTRYEFYSKFDHFTLLQFDFEGMNSGMKKNIIEESIMHVAFHSTLLHGLICYSYNKPDLCKQLDLMNDFSQKTYKL